jgi:hypothetical protein
LRGEPVSRIHIRLCRRPVSGVRLHRRGQRAGGGAERGRGEATENSTENERSTSAEACSFCGGKWLHFKRPRTKVTSKARALCAASRAPTLNYTFEERRDIDASGFAFLAVSQRILLICSSGNRGVYAWGEGTRKRHRSGWMVDEGFCQSLFGKGPLRYLLTSPNSLDYTGRRKQKL